MEEKNYTLEQLSSLTGLTRRTVRYYIQIGLVPRPQGEGRGAFYTGLHLESLLEIKMLTGSGFSLEAIGLMKQEKTDPFPRPSSRPWGSAVVRSHFLLAPGVELQISPEESSLTSAEVRRLTQAVLAAAKNCLEQLRKEKNHDTPIA
jgi:DNA-binding transcriptional MerR regulator